MAALSASNNILLKRADACSRCGKRPGLILGLTVLGLREKGHDARCLKRSLLNAPSEASGAITVEQAEVHEKTANLTEAAVSDGSTSAEESAQQVHPPTQPDPLFMKADLCSRCGKRPGLVFGRTVLGFRAKGHEARCLKRSLLKANGGEIPVEEAADPQQGPLPKTQVDPQEDKVVEVDVGTAEVTLAAMAEGCAIGLENKSVELSHQQLTLGKEPEDKNVEDRTSTERFPTSEFSRTEDTANSSEGGKPTTTEVGTKVNAETAHVNQTAMAAGFTTCLEIQSEELLCQQLTPREDREEKHVDDETTMERIPTTEFFSTENTADSREGGKPTTIEVSIEVDAETAVVTTVAAAKGLISCLEIPSQELSPQQLTPGEEPYEKHVDDKTMEIISTPEFSRTQDIANNSEGGKPMTTEVSTEAESAVSSLVHQLVEPQNAIEGESDCNLAVENVSRTVDVANQ